MELTRKERKAAYNKAYREANKERLREYLRTWKSQNPEYMKQWWSKHPEKRSEYRAVYLLQERAHDQVRRAIKGGKLQRPSICSRCSTECTPEGHHADYSKPLDVEWVCKACHEDIHHSTT
jgi:hypothetical protein